MHIKLMADYCSSGIWNGVSGSMMDLEELQISDRLADDIKKWTNSYERSQFYLDPADRTIDFDISEFNRQGVLLSARLSKELPQWKVTFRPE